MKWLKRAWNAYDDFLSLAWLDRLSQKQYGLATAIKGGIACLVFALLAWYNLDPVNNAHGSPRQGTPLLYDPDSARGMGIFFGWVFVALIFVTIIGTVLVATQGPPKKTGTPSPEIPSE